MRIICCDSTKEGRENTDKGKKGPREQEGWSFGESDISKLEAAIQE
jgi:hypothetical protein